MSFSKNKHGNKHILLILCLTLTMMMPGITLLLDGLLLAGSGTGYTAASGSSALLFSENIQQEAGQAGRFSGRELRQSAEDDNILFTDGLVQPLTDQAGQLTAEVAESMNGSEEKENGTESTGSGDEERAVLMKGLNEVAPEIAAADTYSVDTYSDTETHAFQYPDEPSAEEAFREETVSRGSSLDNDVGGQVEKLPWFGTVDRIFSIGTVATVVDVDTGLSFQVQRTYGYNHADCETLTSEDTEILREIAGGYWNWTRRAAIVIVDNLKIAASIAPMPHAGRDDMPANVVASGLSGGYGTDVNLDAIKGNGMDGHFDIHFLNSRTHGTNRVNAEHQAMVEKAQSDK